MNMKKCLTIFSFVGFWIFIIYGFYLLSLFGTTNTLTFLSKSMPVCINDTAYIVNGEYIIVHNKASSLLQCYNLDGKFIWGIQHEDSRNIDGSLVSYNDGKLYVLEAYTRTVYTFNDFKLVNSEKKKIPYSNNEFYTEYPKDSTAIIECEIKKGKVIVIDETDEIKEVLLNTKYISIPTILPFILASVSIGAFWLLRDSAS